LVDAGECHRVKYESGNEREGRERAFDARVKILRAGKEGFLLQLVRHVYKDSPLTAFEKNGQIIYNG